MNEKLYIENYVSYKYKPPQYLKAVTSDTMGYSSSNIPSHTNHNTNFMDIYTVSSQNFSFQQNSLTSICSQQEQTDVLVWEDKVISENIDTIETCSKDLNLGNYCSNVDLITADLYKPNSSKDINNFNKLENEWSYNQSNCSQRNAVYAPCAQITNVEKNQGIDYVARNCNYNDTFHENCNIHCRNNKYVSNETVSDYVYNYYDNRFIDQPFIQNTQYFTTKTDFTQSVNPADQQTDDSNEESDIVVEESDEEIADYTENQLVHSTNKCLICDVTYKPLGTQFYYLTEKNPLTMSSQKPVIQKLINIIGEISTSSNYLCSECLGHINNIDHLQLKLEQFKSDLVIKFKRTCMENEIQIEKEPYMRKLPRIKKWPRYKCKFCNKILCLKKYCLYHIKRHRNRGYLCDSCGKIYLNKKKFSLHYSQHKYKLCKINSFKCANCNRTFRTRSNQKEHENYCLNVLPFKCKQYRCDKKFPSATKLKSHVRLKHDKKFTIICSICNTGFIKMSDYKCHMISHSADKKHTCPKCHKNYKTLSNLNFHLKIHSNTLPFNCHICKKGFMRKEYLEAHINNHNGVKNFSCPNCEKKFVSQKNLDAHLKYHEGTVKKNTCNICGKSMTSGFEEHLRIHNNLREFECKQCDMKFNTKGALSKHVKKKHF